MNGRRVTPPFTAMEERDCVSETSVSRPAQSLAGCSYQRRAVATHGSPFSAKPAACGARKPLLVTGSPRRPEVPVLPPVCLGDGLAPTRDPDSLPRVRWLSPVHQGENTQLWSQSVGSVFALQQPAEGHLGTDLR